MSSVNPGDVHAILNNGTEQTFPGPVQVSSQLSLQAVRDAFSSFVQSITNSDQ